MNKLTRLFLAAVVGLALCAPAPSDAAFSYDKLRRVSAGQDDGPSVWIYEDTATALATLVAANYMVPTADSSENQRLEVGDLLYVVGSDAVGFVTVATVTSTTGITLTAMSGTAATPGACIESTVTFDPAPTTFGSVEEKDVTATGAALGDTCVVAAPYDLTNQVQAECYVDTADSVVINLRQPGIILRGSESYNATNVDDGNVEVNDVTVTGAALGDPAKCTMSIDVADLVVTASVTAADTVTATLANNTGAAVDLGAATMTCAVEDVSASAVNLASGTWKARTCSAP